MTEGDSFPNPILHPPSSDTQGSMEQKSPEDPVEHLALMAKEGKYLEAYTQWFAMPQDRRITAFQNAFDEIGSHYSRKTYPQEADWNWNTILLDIPLSEKNDFVIKNLPLLYSITGEKLLSLQSTDQVSLRELSSCQYPRQGSGRFVRPTRWAKNVDTRTTPSLPQSFNIIRYGNVSQLPEGNLFKLPQNILKDNLNDDEMAVFFRNLIPRVQREDGLSDQDLGVELGNKLTDIQHMNILTDPQIGDYFRDFCIPDNENIYRNILVNFIYQHYFPSAEYFEKVFVSNNAYTKIDATLQEEDVTFPANLLYFRLLRQLPKLDEYFADKTDPYKIKNETELMRMKGRIVEYVFSDEYMKRVVDYIYKDQEYKDTIPDMNLLQPIDALDLTIVSTGDQARESKTNMLGEVIQAADRFLRETGDVTKAEELKKRVVGDIMFADFLSAA